MMQGEEGREGRNGGRRLWRAAAVATVLGAAAAAAARPAAWALGFALASRRRVLLLVYWVLLLLAALPLMDWVSRARRVPTIIVRKGYHILAMALFTPALLAEPQLLSVSLAIAAALLVAVEVARIGGIPRVGPRIHSFMTAFIDSRDSGLLLVSHFSLLAGMAAPVWLSAVSSTAVGRAVSGLATAYSGIMILGVADSAASALGRRFGRRRILGTRKTAEGTLGGVACTLLAWLLLWPLFGCEEGGSPGSRAGVFGSGFQRGGVFGGKEFGGLASGGGLAGRLLAGMRSVCGGVPLWGLVVATIASCCLEAATTQLDNIFLPLHHYAMLAA